jgi:hypothetical protein
MSAWTDFVKKIHDEGQVKDSSYSFKQAMKDASERKGEMGSSNSVKTKKMRKGKKAKKGGKSRKSKKSKKH